MSDEAPFPVTLDDLLTISRAKGPRVAAAVLGGVIAANDFERAMRRVDAVPDDATAAAVLALGQDAATEDE